MCAHFWIIDGQRIGKCKYCGKIKDFRGSDQLQKYFRRVREPYNKKLEEYKSDLEEYLEILLAETTDKDIDEEDEEDNDYCPNLDKD